MNPAPPKFYCVYILRSLKKNWVYIGLTSDLFRRLEEHRLGKSYSTKRYLPVELVYYEAYRSLIDATMREKSLKKYGNALKLLKKRIRHSLTGGGAG